MRRYAITTVTIVWIAVVLNLGLEVHKSVESGAGVVLGLIKFITAFTSLSNIFIGVVLTAAVAKAQSPVLRFLSKPSSIACAAMYIVVMAAVYAVLLAPSSAPLSIGLLTSVLLHGVTPVLYPFYWLFFTPKRSLTVRHAVLWPAGALIYFVVILIRGAITDAYPYYFIDVSTLGYPQVLLNALLLLGVFVCAGLGFVLLDHWVPWGGPLHRAGAERSGQ